MKPLQRGNKRVKKICLAVTFFAGLAGLFSLALFYVPELKAQNQQWTAVSHDQTNFPLQGRHRSISCAECHLKGVLEGTPSDCEACHWSRRQDDPYQLYFGLHCADCHTPFAWKKLKPNSWNHGQATGFPLAGVHQTMDCSNCHKKNVFNGQSSDCYSCHRQQYERAPNHIKANYSTDCRQCHYSMTTWSGAHTGHLTFPLLGLHKTAACTDCHKNNVYIGTPRECVGCHLQDYNDTRNPNHKLAGYSIDCASCHGSSAQTWNNAVVNHDQYWPLKGPHKNLECIACHASSYNLPTDCYGCHKKDYDATTNPNHKQAGYSTACQDCHFSSHTSWNQAVFNHKFPIKSGKHAGFACTDCHLSSNYLVFSCIDCHAHTKSSMDSKHDDVHGYSYNSQACYTCHPRGVADD